MECKYNKSFLSPPPRSDNILFSHFLANVSPRKVSMHSAGVQREKVVGDGEGETLPLLLWGTASDHGQSPTLSHDSINAALPR
jgi:hypothetical protein